MGPLAWIFTLFAANGALLAGLILGAAGNRAANRFLAALVALIALRLLVYVLGFAGAYDAAPYLTFLPLDASFAFGPLLWLYVATLTEGGPPPRWPLHLAPAALQSLYFAVCFALPMPAKWRWYAGPHLRVVEPLALAAILLSCAAYLVAAWRRQVAYQQWLDERFGNRDQWRLGWLNLLLGAFAATLCVVLLAAAWSIWAGRITYFERVPAILACSGLAYALGLLGWRQAGTLYPPHGVAVADSAAIEPTDRPDAAARWRIAYADWSDRVAAGGWWREEQVTLTDVARLLGVSERTLSRGLREGGGRNFNHFINGFRVDAIKRAIARGEGGDLLSLAFAAGFSSKASFNRAFRTHTGEAPSAWRAAHLPPIAGTARN